MANNSASAGCGSDKVNGVYIVGNWGRITASEARKLADQLVASAELVEAADEQGMSVYAMMKREGYRA